ISRFRHDFSIFRENSGKYKCFLRKQLVETPSRDPLPNQTHWALLADKGYIGAERILRAIIPKKASPRQRLHQRNEEFNKRVSSARIVCENFYRRKKGLFRICRILIEVIILI